MCGSDVRKSYKQKKSFFSLSQTWMFAKVGRKILQFDFLELLDVLADCIYHVPVA